MSNSKYADIYQQADNLLERHVEFTDLYIRKGNEVLYKLLADIMEFADTIISDEKSANKIIADMRKTLRTQYNVRTQKNTPHLSIIVRYIVRTSRKTAHTYARVLSIALENNVKCEDLPKFIKEHGGIERIRASNDDLISTQKRKRIHKLEREAAVEYLNNCEQTPITHLDIDNKFGAELHDTHGRGDFNYLICKRDSINGGFNIVGLIPMYNELEDKILEQVYATKFDERSLQSEPQKIATKSAIDIVVERHMKSKELAIAS